jgi:hypothetical protein
LLTWEQQIAATVSAKHRLPEILSETVSGKKARLNYRELPLKVLVVCG